MAVGPMSFFSSVLFHFLKVDFNANKTMDIEEFLRLMLLISNYRFPCCYIRGKHSIFFVFFLFLSVCYPATPKGLAVDRQQHVAVSRDVGCFFEANHNVVSNASCTTNCLAPIVHVLLKENLAHPWPILCELFGMVK